jgi:hypothetical protein
VPDARAKANSLPEMKMSDQPSAPDKATETSLFYLQKSSARRTFIALLFGLAHVGLVVTAVKMSMNYAGASQSSSCS